MSRKTDLKGGLNAVFSGVSSIKGDQGEKSSPNGFQEPVGAESVEEPIVPKNNAASSQNQTPEGRVDKPAPHKERIQPFNLQIPGDLHARLKFYVENHGRRHESMTRIILDGIELTLSEREEKVGLKKS